LIFIFFSISDWSRFPFFLFQTQFLLPFVPFYSKYYIDFYVFFYVSFSIILFRILLVCSRITFYKLNKSINFVTEDSCSFSPLTSLKRCIIVPFVFFELKPMKRR
jgi:hypothetical protein